MSVKEDIRVLTLDDFEHRMVVHALNDLRSEQIEQQRSTEDVDALLLRTIDAPHKKKCVRKRGHDR